MALSLELLITAPYVLIEPQLCSEAIQKLGLSLKRPCGRQLSHGIPRLGHTFEIYL